MHVSNMLVYSAQNPTMILLFWDNTKTITSIAYFNVFTQNANYCICPHRALLCMMQNQLSIKKGVSLLYCCTKLSRSLHGTWSEFFGDEWRISSSIYDSPAYFGTLDSSMDQKQWSKANTCRGDSTGSVTTHFSHLSEHVQYNATWSFLVVVLLAQWYKNRLIMLYHTVNQQDWACPSE